MAYRESGIIALNKFIKTESNVDIIEKYLFKYSRSEKEYQHLLYETIGMLIQNSNISRKECLQSIIDCIHSDRFNWTNPIYAEFKQREKEAILFQTDPLEVEEGILQCGKCGSNKTISYSKQIRASDESSSVFAQCAICKHKWQEA